MTTIILNQKRRKTQNMDGIILPSVFESKNDKNKISHKVKSQNKINNRSDDTDDSNTNSTLSSDNEKNKISHKVNNRTDVTNDSNNNSTLSSDNETNNTPPVYDGIEPYYIFRRRWDAYIQKSQNKTTYDNILKFLNETMNTNYKSLIAMKKIDKSTLPSFKKILELITQNSKYETLFRYMINSKQNNMVPLDSSKDESKASLTSHRDVRVLPNKIINRLLNNIGFSLIEIKNKKEIYYTVKSYVIKNDSDYNN